MRWFYNLYPKLLKEYKEHDKIIVFENEYEVVAYKNGEEPNSMYDGDNDEDNRFYKTIDEGTKRELLNKLSVKRGQ
jgi:hypothetical protein